VDHTAWGAQRNPPAQLRRRLLLRRLLLLSCCSTHLPASGTAGRSQTTKNPSESRTIPAVQAAAPPLWDAAHPDALPAPKGNALWADVAHSTSWRANEEPVRWGSSLNCLESRSPAYSLLHADTVLLQSGRRPAPALYQQQAATTPMTPTTSWLRGYDRAHPVMSVTGTGRLTAGAPKRVGCTVPAHSSYVARSLVRVLYGTLAFSDFP
jgi:hypothetical protein